MKSPLTTHVLDTARGRPAAGLAVRLERCRGDRWTELSRRRTDGDGRVGDLLAPGALEAGVYRLVFATGDYFAASGTRGFYPQVTVEFEVTAAGEHHHVPLLLSPFGYSTYRGS
jgi:5-hydroxyisourate hydrolase